MENRDYLLWKWQGLRLSWGVRSPSELTWESGNLVDPLLSYYGNNVSVSHMHTHTHTSVNMHHVIILSVLSWFYHSAPPSSSSPTDFRTLYFLITCSSLETKADLQAMTAPPQGPPLLKHTHTHTQSPLKAETNNLHWDFSAGGFGSAELLITFSCPAAEEMRTFWCFSALTCDFILQ